MPIKGRLVTYIGPDYKAELNKAVKDYLPIAGRRLMFAARAKIGVYQPGWPPLAESTRRKKYRSLRGMGRRRAPWMRWTGGGADQPLIDTGAMANSIRHDESGYETCVSAAFPMEVHEQDPDMAIISPGKHTPPRRAVLGPTLDENLDAIAEEATDFVGSRL